VKKICINGKFFCQPTTGTQRYARELLNQFDRLLASKENRDLAIEVLVPRDAREIPQYSQLKIKSVGGNSGTFWEQIELPRNCGGNLLFTPSGGAPALYSRNVVTIHDAAVAAAPTGYSLAYRLWYGNLCRRMARTAEHIFTVSNFSKSEIVKWYRAAAEKVSVTYLGSEHFSNLKADASTLARFGIAGKYVLAVSSHNPNKNFHRVVEALTQLGSNWQLVIAGGNDSRVYQDSLKLPAGVRAVGYVTDAELKALYENAACFVFASLYEGFGLPPLEAMSSGCPVVLSRAAALPEIFNGVAQFCDPYHAEDIAAAIERAVRSPLATPDELENFARKFSWEKCARETLAVLKRF
jgi:glycosyltransferase involved in cell wall biosynthesis